MDGTTALVTALGGAAAAILGAWALVIKARGEAARPQQLLRRLWDWIEGAALHHDVPPTLAAEIRDEIEGDNPHGQDRTSRP